METLSRIVRYRNSAFLVLNIFTSVLLGVYFRLRHVIERARLGEDATLFPDGERIKKAAVHSLKDPDTWVPAAGAAVFSIGDWDKRVSQWGPMKRHRFLVPRRMHRRRVIIFSWRRPRPVPGPRY